MSRSIKVRSLAPTFLQVLRGLDRPQGIGGDSAVLPQLLREEVPIMGGEVPQSPEKATSQPRVPPTPCKVSHLTIPTQSQGKQDQNSQFQSSFVSLEAELPTGPQKQTDVRSDHGTLCVIRARPHTWGFASSHPESLLSGPSLLPT